MQNNEANTAGTYKSVYVGLDADAPIAVTGVFDIQDE